jgi:hypothetical protein
VPLCRLIWARVRGPFWREKILGFLSRPKIPKISSFWKFSFTKPCKSFLNHWRKSQIRNSVKSGPNHNFFTVEFGSKTSCKVGSGSGSTTRGHRTVHWIMPRFEDPVTDTAALNSIRNTPEYERKSAIPIKAAPKDASCSRFQVENEFSLSFGRLASIFIMDLDTKCLQSSD